MDPGDHTNKRRKPNDESRPLGVAVQFPQQHNNHRSSSPVSYPQQPHSNCPAYSPGQLVQFRPNYEIERPADLAHGQQLYSHHQNQPLPAEPTNFLSYLDIHGNFLQATASPEPSIVITPLESDLILYLVLHSITLPKTIAAQLNLLRRPQHPAWLSTLVKLVETYLQCSTLPQILNLVPPGRNNIVSNVQEYANVLVEQLVQLARSNGWKYYVHSVKDLFQKSPEQREERMRLARERIALKKYKVQGSLPPKWGARNKILQQALARERLKEQAGASGEGKNPKELDERSVLIERVVRIWTDRSLVVDEEQQTETPISPTTGRKTSGGGGT